MKKLKNYVIVGVIAVGAGVGIYFWARSAVPKTEDLSIEIPVMENIGHIAVGSALPKYTSNPPTSGQHYSQTARSGFRDQPIADQNVIHNLEHGDVWIAYHPRVSDEVKNQLKKFGAAKVIITPREANDTDIALASWGRLDAFDIENNTLPAERVGDFIKRHSNKGPEQIPGASGGI